MGPTTYSMCYYTLPYKTILNNGTLWYLKNHMPIFARPFMIHKSKLTENMRDTKGKWLSVTVTIHQHVYELSLHVGSSYKPQS